MFGDMEVVLGDKNLTVDDIIFGYERLFESYAGFTFTNFLGVPMQQGAPDLILYHYT